jgi:valyl-tRNA synthetase
LCNASGFASKLLADYYPQGNATIELQLLDEWIISKTENLTKKVTEAFEKCQFNIAVEDIRNFTWHVFCDNYLEAVKDRLYRPDAHGQGSRLAAQYTLYEVLYRLLQLLAPVTPHVTEEIYQYMFAEGKGYSSLQITPWPEYNPQMANDEAEAHGDLVIAIMSEIRRDKAERKLPLNAPIKKLTVYAVDEHTTEVVESTSADISSTLKIAEINVLPEKCSEGRQVGQSGVYIQTEY